MQHHPPAQLPRTPLVVSYLVDPAIGRIASARAAWATVPYANKIALRLLRKGRQRGVMSKDAYIEAHSVALIMGGRVIRVYGDGSIAPMVGPAYVDGQAYLDPHGQNSLFERCHVGALHAAARMRRRGWKDSARVDLGLAKSLRCRRDPRRMGEPNGYAV